MPPVMGLHVDNYQTTSGTLTFPAGTTSQSIIVPVLNDHQNNPNLYLTIALTGPVNAALGDPPSATLWIIDQDAPPMISINNVSQNEGNGGMTNFTFTVTLSAKSGNFVTVDYAPLMVRQLQAQITFRTPGRSHSSLAT